MTGSIQEVVAKLTEIGISVFDARQVQKQPIPGGRARQDIPFEVLVEHLNPSRHGGHDPIFQIVIGLNKSHREVTCA